MRLHKLMSQLSCRVDSSYLSPFQKNIPPCWTAFCWVNNWVIITIPPPRSLGHTHTNLDSPNCSCHSVTKMENDGLPLHPHQAWHSSYCCWLFRNERSLPFLPLTIYQLVRWKRHLHIFSFLGSRVQRITSPLLGDKNVCKSFTERQYLCFLIAVGA